MPVRGTSSRPVHSTQQHVQIRPGSRWHPSPSMDQARHGHYIKKGQAGDAVRDIQQMLNAAGAQPPLDADGYLGKDSDTALRQFQGQHGLSADGLVGTETLNALQHGTSTETHNSSRHRSDSRHSLGLRGLFSRSSNRNPQLGAETQPTGPTGALGALSHGQLSRSSIDWSNPSIRPPNGRITKPSATAFKAAVNSYNKLKREGKTKTNKMVLMDMSRPSTESRMWVIDMDSKKLLAQHRVAHGSGSGVSSDPRLARNFSDRNHSHKTSLGAYVTAETYSGKHGLSLKLDGQERGFNRSARSRYVVMHSANYASDSFVRQHGYLGRSQGCPAMDPAVAHNVINMVKEGSAMLIYGNDANYQRNSHYING